MNILLDTNIWVSAMISGSMRARIQRIIADENISILASDDLFAETRMMIFFWPFATMEQLII